MFYGFKIKFENELSYTQFKEVSKFLHELSNSTVNAINGISFLYRGEEGNYTITINIDISNHTNNYIVINLV